MSNSAIFITKVRQSTDRAWARLLIESIRDFGGASSAYPIWIFASEPKQDTFIDLKSSQVQVFPLVVPEAIQRYPFGDKVLACAQAESMATPETQSLIWLDLNCLVVQPPVLFELGQDKDVALRPVHIRNVGLPVSEPLDKFWQGIYTTIGIADIALTVESFIDQQRLRAYYNSHGLAVNPKQNLFRGWYTYFAQLVHDDHFQTTACPDESHRIFLFQALFSALVATTLDVSRIRLLPPTYNYPYNLHHRIPPDRRAIAFNDLVCFTYEDRAIHPDQVQDIEIRQPLRTWLQSRADI